MELLTFPSQKRYVSVQARTQKKRSKRPGFEWRELRKIAKYASRRCTVRDVLCHGARDGAEVACFRKLLPSAYVVGTDLIHESDDVIKHDFHVQDRLWIGRFDLIYSNSLDHSHSPQLALMVWLDQLTAAGRLCVQWTPWHVAVAGGDCFGAALHEYVAVMNQVGRVEDVLFIHPHKFVIIVVKRTGRRRRW